MRLTPRLSLSTPVPTGLRRLLQQAVRICEWSVQVLIEEVRAQIDRKGSLWLRLHSDEGRRPDDVHVDVEWWGDNHRLVDRRQHGHLSGGIHSVYGYRCRYGWYLEVHTGGRPDTDECVPEKRPCVHGWASTGGRLCGAALSPVSGRGCPEPKSFECKSNQGDRPTTRTGPALLLPGRSDQVGSSPAPLLLSSSSPALPSASPMALAALRRAVPPPPRAASACHRHGPWPWTSHSVKWPVPRRHSA